MDYLILNNPSLSKFIEDTSMTDEQRKEILKDLPYMDQEQRIKLLWTLLGIHELGQEKQQAIKKVKERYG